MKIAIIGLGVAGSMTAWRLAERGHEVHGYDQFAPGHASGSSHGESRIIRRVYPDPYYTRLMSDSYALWHEFTSAACDESLLPLSGGLFIGPRDHPDIAKALHSMVAAQATHEVLDYAESAHRFPGLTLAPNEIALYDPAMGYARASAVVAAAQRLASASGAFLRFDATCTVTAGESPAIATGDATESYDSIVVACGAWTNQQLSPLGVALPLTVTRQVYINLQTRYDTDHKHAFPVWIDAASLHYGFPELSPGSGCKIARHIGADATTAETVNRTVTDRDRAPLIESALSRLVNVTPQIVTEGTCLYTNTPDEDFVTDRIPGHENIVVVSACSGHGFKFAPLVGEIAADLATNQPVNQDISRFRLNRF